MTSAPPSKNSLGHTLAILGVVLMLCPVFPIVSWILQVNTVSHEIEDLDLAKMTDVEDVKNSMNGISGELSSSMDGLRSSLLWSLPIAVAGRMTLLVAKRRFYDRKPPAHPAGPS